MALAAGQDFCATNAQQMQNVGSSGAYIFFQLISSQGYIFFKKAISRGDRNKICPFRKFVEIN